MLSHIEVNSVDIVPGNWYQVRTLVNKATGEITVVREEFFWLDEQWNNKQGDWDE